MSCSYKIIWLNDHIYTIVDEDKYVQLSNYTWSNNSGYAMTKKDGEHILLHRLLMNPKQGLVVDHINGDTLDNRISNLRICKQSDNLKNIKNRENTSSEYKGVDFRKKTGLYRARITSNKKIYNLGLFTDEIACANCYNYWALVYHGEYSRLNDVDYMEYEEWNRFKVEKEKTSSHKGISRSSRDNVWISTLSRNGKTVFRDIFNSEEEAILAYSRAVADYEMEMHKKG